MTARLRHFAVNAEDVGRARRFYEAVTGWRYAPWGPPDFMNTRDGNVTGALQARRELAGRPQTIEITLGVDDLDVALAAVDANGGRLVEGPFHIEGVGELAWVEDSEGNILGLMRYEAGVE